jgi:hypothetical protein
MDELIIRHGFFAGCTLNWPKTEFLSTAEQTARRWAA